jgi:hypothetical protein
MADRSLAVSNMLPQVTENYFSVFYNDKPF